MKKTKLILFIILTLSVCLFAQQAVFAQPVLIVGVENLPEEPWLLGSGDALPSKPGAAVDIMNHIATKHNFTVQYVREPWARLTQASIPSGTIDFLLLITWTKEREVTMEYPMLLGNPDPSKALFNYDFKFYVPKNSSLAGKDWSALKGARIGGIRGYAVIEHLKAAGFTNVLEITSTEQMIAMVKAGRIDMFCDLSERNDAIEDLVSLPMVFQSTPSYFIASKQAMSKNSRLINLIWEEIKAMRESGAIQAIKEKY